ncbi:MAG: acyl carrier protein [Alphaproteobacteria bacterium]|nr:acyl carrier protein [Alphaproteobacteria bacterium]
MTRDELRRILLDELGRLAPEVDLASLDEQSDLREALELDSISFLNFMTVLDKRLGVVVPEADYPMLYSLSGALDYLERHLSDRRS